MFKQGETTDSEDNESFDWVDSSINNLIGFLVSSPISNSYEIANDIVNFIYTNTGITIPQTSGPVIITPLGEITDGILAGGAKIAEFVNKHPYAAPIGINTLINTVINMKDGENLGEALIHSGIVSTGTVVGVETISYLLNIPKGNNGTKIIIGVLTGVTVDALYSFLQMNQIVESIGTYIGFIPEEELVIDGE